MKLIIHTDNPGGKSTSTWDELSIEEVIKGIKIQYDLKNPQNSSKLSEVISGYPTPLARANVFGYAITAFGGNSNEKNRNTVLDEYYKNLLDEWKGMIAAFALSPENTFKATKIELNYTGNTQDLKGIDNLYEVKGAIGNMLFEQKESWASKDGKPFIELIKYRGITVGGTSPESLIFTAPDYEISDNEDYVNETTKKFSDPVKNKNLDQDKLLILKFYIESIISKINTVEDKKYRSIAVFLDSWSKEINDKITKKESSDVNDISIFKEYPFSEILNISTQIYVKPIDGTIYAGHEKDTIPFNPKDLLLKDEDLELAEINIIAEPNIGIRNIIKDLPIYVLPAKYKHDSNQNEEKFYALPITMKALEIFGDRIQELLDKFIEAKYDDDGYIEITLRLRYGNKNNISNKTYKTNRNEINHRKQIVVWPNFKSKNWNKYYYFSEYPHDSSSGWQSFPIVKDIKEEEKNVYSILPDATGVGKRLIGGSHKKSFDYNYEIYESEHPFVGLELRYRNPERGVIKGGIILVKNNKLALHKETKDVSPVNIGFDFGSNNTCIAYSFQDRPDDTRLIQFKNRRISFFSEEKSHKEANLSNSIVQPFEMLFFPKEELWSNKIKSVLSLHDTDRIIPEDDSKPSEQDYQTLVKGGFPCFEKNLVIQKYSDGLYTIGTKEELLSVDMVYNMKWSSKDRDNSYKIGFIRNLLLMVYAELFQHKDKTAYPKALNWALPSAMPKSMIENYNHNIWKEISSNCNPLVTKNNDGYSLKIATYTDSSSSEYLSTSNQENNSNNQNLAEQRVPDSINSTLLPLPSDNDNITPENPNFIEIEPGYPITESIAVAKYAVLDKERQRPDVGKYIIGLDVGGSTTDILAITSFDSDPVLVKQSSIRLAAGNIADATKKISSFERVLVNFIRKNQKELNFSETKIINTENISFYYNLILDRLISSDLQEKFYTELSVNCKPIFAINLYITGILMYYTGMLSRKINKYSLEHKEKFFTKELEKVELRFFGTGSKMFFWFYYNEPQKCREYYAECFLKGYEEPRLLELTIPDLPPNLYTTSISMVEPDKIKVEVAMGLANQSFDESRNSNSKHGLRILKNNSDLDIIGDNGYILYEDNDRTKQRKKLESLDQITPALIQRLSKQILRPNDDSSNNSKYPRFKEFIEIYFNKCNKYLNNISRQDAILAINEINILDLLNKDEGYRYSSKNTPDFIVPLFILQAQGFMENYLIPKLNESEKQ